MHDHHAMSKNHHLECVCVCVCVRVRVYVSVCLCVDQSRRSCRLLAQHLVFGEKFLCVRRLSHDDDEKRHEAAHPKPPVLHRLQQLWNWGGGGGRVQN